MIPFLSRPKFNAGADFNQTEAIALRLQLNAGDISSPVQGQVFFDTTAEFPKVYDGSAWLTPNPA